MSVEKVEMFTVICDNCGVSADEGTDYACWNDANHAREVAVQSGYLQEGNLHYCPKCFDYDEEDNLIIKKIEK